MIFYDAIGLFIQKCVNDVAALIWYGARLINNATLKFNAGTGNNWPLLAYIHGKELSMTNYQL